MYHGVTGPFHRRDVLRAALGATTASAAGALLAACGGTRTIPATTPPVASAATNPATGVHVTVTAIPGSGATMAVASAPSATSIPATSAAPGPTAAPMDGKLPAPAEGVPDAYTKTPAPFKSYEGKPGRGGTVTSFTIAYNAPPPPREQNQFWQALEKRLGVTWDPTITPQPDYGAKSAALIAGDMPELFYLNPGQNAAPQYKAMEQGAFLDLTPYLTGDAVKEYRNLATFPRYLWDNVKFKGKIYGVELPRLGGQ